MMMDHYIKNKIKLFLIIFSFMFLLSGCNNENLNNDNFMSPANLYIDEDEVLHWDSVDGASGYQVSVYEKETNENEFFKTTDNEYDLFEILSKPIKYSISVSAYKYINSEYIQTKESNLLDYTIEDNLKYLTFKEIENGEAYEVSTESPNDINGKLIIPSEINNKPVKNISNKAFYNCDNIKNVIIPDSIEIIGVNAFYNCDNLRKVMISNKINNLNQTFCNCYSLKELNIPNGVVKLDNPISNCEKLEYIYIPPSVSYISTNFHQTLKNLKKVEIDENNLKYKVENDCIIDIENDTLIAAGHNFSGIPLSVSIIGEKAFSSCDFIKEITIPSNVKIIGVEAFAYCSNLEKIVLNDGLEQIRSSAFDSCYNLESQIIIPKTVKNIGDRAFYNCLTTFILYDSIEDFYSTSFINDVVYSNIKCDEINKYVGSISGCFFIFNCEIENDNILSFHFYNYEVVEGIKHTSYFSYPYNKYQQYIIRVPKRDGYEFLGWTDVKDSSTAIYKKRSIEQTLKIQIMTNAGKYAIEYVDVFDYSIDIEEYNNIPNDTILYAVWKKIDKVSLSD